MSEEEEVVFEVRKQGDIWKVYYPQEDGIKTAVPVYDKEGKLKTVVYAGEPTGKLTELFEDFDSQEAAMERADELGAEKINIVKTKTRGRPKKVKEPEYLKPF